MIERCALINAALDVKIDFQFNDRSCDSPALGAVVKSLVEQFATEYTAIYLLE